MGHGLLGELPVPASLAIWDPADAVEEPERLRAE